MVSVYSLCKSLFKDFTVCITIRLTISGTMWCRIWAHKTDNKAIIFKILQECGSQVKYKGKWISLSSQFEAQAMWGIFWALKNNDNKKVNKSTFFVSQSEAHFELLKQMKTQRQMNWPCIKEKTFIQNVHIASIFPALINTLYPNVAVLSIEKKMLKCIC